MRLERRQEQQQYQPELLEELDTGEWLQPELASAGESCKTKLAKANSWGVVPYEPRFQEGRSRSKRWMMPAAPTAVTCSRSPGLEMMVSAYVLAMRAAAEGASPDATAGGQLLLPPYLHLDLHAILLRLLLRKCVQLLLSRHGDVCRLLKVACPDQPHDINPN